MPNNQACLISGKWPAWTCFDAVQQMNAAFDTCLDMQVGKCGVFWLYLYNICSENTRDL